MSNFTESGQGQYNLEDTHLSNGYKIDKLIAVITLSFIFTLGWACIKRAKEAQSRYSKRKSHFRYGLDDLIRILASPNDFKDHLERFSKWLSSGTLTLLFDV